MVRIITLNIGYGMFLEELMKYLHSVAPETDVFCFQEVDKVTKDALDTLLADKFVPYGATKFDKDEKFLLATYVSRGFAVLETEEILNDSEDVGLGLTCRVEDGHGRPFAVTNVHGFPRPGAKLDTEKRLIQSSKLIEAAETDSPHVFIGDFNLLPEAESVRVFARSGFRDLIQECKVSTTRNEIIWQRFPDNKQLFADYVFVKNGETLACELVTHDVIVSDHLPLVFSMELQNFKYFKPNTKLVSNSGNASVSQVLKAAN